MREVPPSSRRRVARLGAVSALLSLCACGASPWDDYRVLSRAIVVQSGPLADGVLGETDIGDPVMVTIREGLPAGEFRRRVVVHEMLHAVGLAAHEERSDCYLYSGNADGAWSPGEHFCPEELERLLGVGPHTFAAWAVPDLVDDLGQAILLINRESGRPIVTLVNTPAESTPVFSGRGP